MPTGTRESVRSIWRSRSALASSGAWLVAGEGLNRAGRFVVLLLIARNLGPEAYAPWVLAAVLGTLLANTADAGLNLTVTAAVAADRTRVRAALANLWSIAGIIAGGTALTAVISIGGLRLSLLDVVVILTASGALDSATYLLLAPLRGLGRMRWEAIIRAFEGVALLGGGAVALYTGWGTHWVPAVFLCVSVTAFTAAVLANLVSFGAVRPRLDASYVKESLKATAPVFAATIVTLVYFRLDIILLSRLQTARETGLYGAAYNFTFGASFLAVTAGRAMLPKLASEPSTGRFRATYGATFRMSAIAGAGFATSLIVCAPLVMRIYGPGFEGALTPYLLLSTAQALFFLTQCNYVSLLARGCSGRAARALTVATIINASSNLVLIPILGATGAACTMLVSESTLLAIQTFEMRRLTGLSVDTTVASSREPLKRAA